MNEQKKIRFGSVCSGIEAASVAWHPLGWQAAWLSEIEPFPSAVLAHHYPDVPNLGDMTKLPERILSGEVEAPDLFCGGTPCQAFSVAGLRNSLDDARGNLSLTFCEIANAIDDIRLAGGNKPAIIFWENVPGVLSTKDNAFGCFLGALAGEDQPLQPAGGKWTDAGVVLGPQRAVAWRILDAQYFSLAQRRRRVFVVSSAREDFDPAAVLLEWEGVRRDSAPSRETGKAVAPRTGSGFEGGICGSLTARFGGNAMGAPEVDAGLYIPMSQPIAWDEELNASIDQAGTILRGGAGGRHDGVMQPIGVPEVMATLLSSTAGIARTGNAVTEHETYIPMAAQPVAQPIHYRKSRRAQSTTDYETWVEDDAANTLNCFDVGDIRATDVVAQPVAQPMVLMDQGGSVMNVEHDMVGTLRRETHGHEPVVMQPIPLDLRNAGRDPEKHDEMNRQGVGVGTPGEPAHTVTSAFVHGVAQPVAVGTDCYNGSITGDVACTMGTPGSSINASGPTVMVGAFKSGQSAAARSVGYETEMAPSLEAGGGGNNKPAIHVGMQVRRLTPVECERLQGFPDIKKTYTIEVCHEAEKPENAASAEQSSAALSHAQSKPAAVHVRINLERQEVHLPSPARSSLSASTAENPSMSRPLMQSEDIAHLVALMTPHLDRITGAGRAASQASTTGFSLRLSGSRSVRLSGQEIDALASDADRFTSTVSACLKSITSEVGQSSPSYERSLQTLCCCVVAAINSCIQGGTSTKSSYALSIETEIGYTAIPWRKKPASECPDGPRYKALGNSWAVPNVRWIGQRIADQINKKTS